MNARRLCTTRMGRVLRTLAIAGALAVIVLSVGWLAGDAAPARAQDLVLTKTVGTTPAGCATTQEMTVTVGASVYYCLTVRNTSTVTYTRFQMSDPTLRVSYTMTRTLSPGQEIVRTSANISRLGPVRHTVSTTNTAYVTGTIQGGGTTSVQASARAHLVAPDPLNASILITKTVGLAPDVCATGTELVIDRGQLVYYCLTVTNNGNVPYTLYEYNDAQLGISGATTEFTFWPGAVITRTNTIFPKLGPVTHTVSLTNTVTVDASGPYADAFSLARARLTVIQPPPEPSIVVTKTVGQASGVCASAASILIQPSTPVYFCISVQNTGNVNLAQIVLRDFMQKSPPLTAVITRTTTLQPGEVLTFTNAIQGLAFLGPVVQTADFTNLVDVEATGPSGGADGSASAFVDVFPARENKIYLPTVVR